MNDIVFDHRHQPNSDITRQKALKRLNLTHIRYCPRRNKPSLQLLPLAEKFW